MIGSGRIGTGRGSARRSGAAGALDKRHKAEAAMVGNANPADTQLRGWPVVTLIALEERDDVPNNPRLPALIYAAALDPGVRDLAQAFEKRFAANGWPPQWRDGIYDFHHYHSEGHEVLGIAGGRAELIIGGERGRRISVAAGDVLLLPAGTGHCRVEASRDFLVVGGYPPGQSGDIRREPTTAAVRQRIAALPRPKHDPVLGADGPLLRHWSEFLLGNRN